MQQDTTEKKYVDYQGYTVLKDLYKDYFKIGSACEAIHPRNTRSEIGNEAKEGLIARQFASITFGNELKPAYNMGFDSPETTETNLVFSINPAAKTMLDFAKKNGITVRGHVLVWHSQCSHRVFCKNYEPVYLNADELNLKEFPWKSFMGKIDPACFATRETVIKRLESYIHSVMKYMFKNGYANTIYAWDVVNEAIELDDKTPTGLRNSYWYQTIGEDFMYFAFKYAREAEEKYAKEYASQYGIDAQDENALKSIQPKLFYNDYNEWMPAKIEAILGALKRETAEHGSIIGEGFIDGIGMQGHLSDNNNIKEYISALMTYSKEVSEVHITELDIKETCTNINADYYQAVFYKTFFSALIEANKNGAKLTSVTLWGLTDDNSWIQGANPLIFRGDLSKKPSFDGMVYAITGESLGEPVAIACDISDRFVDFEAADTTPEQLGFKVRGAGEILIQKEVSHNGKAALQLTKRRGPWSGINYDVSDFIGQTIELSVWIKSNASTVTLNADINGPWPLLGTVDTSSGEWVQMKSTYKIPNNLYSLILYFSATDPDMMVSNDVYIDDLSVHLVGLEESFEEETNIASIRGAGHLPHCFVTDQESVDGKGHSYGVTRQEKDATIKFSVTPYIGKKVSVTLFVKTTDKKIRLGLDGPTPLKVLEADSNIGDWTKLSAQMEIPSDLITADLYLETDGNADFYVDDIFVQLV